MLPVKTKTQVTLRNLGVYLVGRMLLFYAIRHFGKEAPAFTIEEPLGYDRIGMGMSCLSLIFPTDPVTVMKYLGSRCWVIGL